jgi:hypothetical protein
MSQLDERVLDCDRLAHTSETSDKGTLLDREELLQNISGLVGVGSRHHHVEEGHLFVVLELLHLHVPWDPGLGLSQVIVVVEDSVAVRNLSRFEIVSDEVVEEFLASFVATTTHAPRVSKAHD